MIHAEARGAHGDLSDRLRPFIARRVQPADVDDVLQDVFLRVQRGLGGLRDDERFGPWVYRVARNAISDQRRTRRRHPLANGDVDLPDEEAAPESESVAEQELAHCVAPMIAMLPSPYREALTLTELEGVSQKQAAERVGISVSGMKSRVQRGREHLRALFEDCCEIALDARGRVVGFEPRQSAARRETRCSCSPEGPTNGEIRSPPSSRRAGP